MKSLNEILNAEQACFDEIRLAERSIDRLTDERKCIETYPFDCPGKAADLAAIDKLIEQFSKAKETHEQQLYIVQEDLRNYLAKLFE